MCVCVTVAAEQWVYHLMCFLNLAKATLPAGLFCFFPLSPISKYQNAEFSFTIWTVTISFTSSSIKYVLECREHCVCQQQSCIGLFYGGHGDVPTFFCDAEPPPWKWRLKDGNKPVIVFRYRQVSRDVNHR